MARNVQVRLMSGRLLTSSLPASPLGTAKTIVGGVDLQVWEVQRDAGALTIVYSLDDVSGGNISTNGEGDNNTGAISDLEQGLSTNTPAGDGDGASDVSFFDPVNLTDYETFCKVSPNGFLSACLDSIDDVELPGNGANEYFAAIVAAPPASATSGTFVSGAGSVPDVPISG